MLYATHAVVDLAAIRANLLATRSLVGDRAVLVAVKANAYGHGAIAVAEMVQRTGCADWLGVATLPEAIELREAGIELPILKLSHCFPEELSAAIEHRVCLTVVDEQTIRQAEAAAAAAGMTAQVQLKLDTGMRRIGSDPEAAVDLGRLVDQSPHLELLGIFTHLPVGDMADQHDWTVAELDRFRAAVTAVVADRGEAPQLVHATASGGTLWHDLSGMTMVRPGIMAYGYYPDASTPRTVELVPAMSWRSRVSFIKQVRAGETVGYGRTWAAPHDTWLATVPIGYADGYSRLHSNATGSSRGRMLVGGRSVPIAGRVCMDQTMLDLGPERPNVRVGDEVVVLGRQGDEQITADDLAAVMGTISYEVTCLVGPRVTRHYVDEG